MPWKRSRGGYKTGRGGHIKRPRQYEGLRERGMPKQRAAQIANRKRNRS